MYYVYKILLPFNHVYIGTSNNLRRRKDQHNENARKQKSYFGKYLWENNTILSLDNFEIIYSSEDRKLALEKEDYYIRYYDNHNDYISLNESKTKIEKKKNIIHKTSMNFVIVDFINHKFIIVNNLRDYELKNGFSRGSIHRTCMNKYSVTQNKYKAFHLEEWNSMSEELKEFYLSGKFLLEKEQKIRENKIFINQKEYLLESKKGEIIKIKNLDKFAEENGINKGDLHNSYNDKHWCKGYRVIERL